MKKQKASIELKKFFDKVLEIKEFCKEHSEKSVLVKKIYDQLDDLIKNGEKE